MQQNLDKSRFQSVKKKKDGAAWEMDDLAQMGILNTRVDNLQLPSSINDVSVKETYCYPDSFCVKVFISTRQCQTIFGTKHHSFCVKHSRF